MTDVKLPQATQPAAQPRKSTPSPAKRDESQKTQPAPNSNSEQKDKTKLSPEAKKPEPSGARKGLLDGLVGNYGGGERLKNDDKKLETLSDSQLENVKKKREMDKAITEHEDAHFEVAGDLARSGATYTTETGEDGQEYRVAGKVMIDTGTEADPEKTVSKMKQVKKAALAPEGNVLAPLSDQDRKVAREADEKLQKAENVLAGREKPTNDSGHSAGSSF